MPNHRGKISVYAIMQYSKLLGRLVLDCKTTEELGRVDQVWINPETHCAIAIRCQAGFLGKNKQTFTWNQITAIGEDSLLVDPTLISSADLMVDKADPGINREVWTDSGNQVGKVIDYRFDPKTGQIDAYLFTSKGWTSLIEGVYAIPITTITSMGSKRLIVPAPVIDEMTPFIEGVTHKVAKAGEFIKQDIEETQQHLETVKDGLQTAIGKGKAIANHIKDQAQSLLKTQAESTDEDDSTQTIDVTASDVTELTALKPVDPDNNSQSSHSHP